MGLYNMNTSSIDFIGPVEQDDDSSATSAWRFNVLFSSGANRYVRGPSLRGLERQRTLLADVCDGTCDVGMQVVVGLET